MSMIRKPKLKNWLKLLFLYIPITGIIIWGFYHQFYKSYPEIPKPLTEYIDSTIVSTSLVASQDNIVKNADVVESKTLFSVITGKEQDALLKNEIDDNIKQELETEINNLKIMKSDLEENISKLKEDNAKLSKISYEMQEAIIKFVEKSRVRDMFASAFVGAVISLLLTFILTRPVILKAVDYWLWKYVEKRE